MSGPFSSQSLNRRYRHFNVRIAESIARIANNATVADFGAGIGLYVAYLRAVGCYAVGYDGTKGVEKSTGGLVRRVDLSVPCNLPVTNFVMSIEVGEHIPCEFEATFIDNLCNHASVGIVVSWATPRQRGRGHVNCRSPEYLIGQFEKRGWLLSPLHTERLRSEAGSPFDKKIMLFRKTINRYDVAIRKSKEGE